MTAALRLPLAPVVPTTRGDCLPGGSNEARPCRYRGCKWHLDRERRWTERVANFEESCVLDVADRGGATLEEIADMIGITRERVRQVEELAMDRFTRRFLDSVR